VPDLDFDHEATENGGSTWPETHTIKGVHPDSGEQVGFLKYRTPRRAKDKIKIDRLEVHPEHQGNGFGSQMMDHLQERHPKTSTRCSGRPCIVWMAWTRSSRATTPPG
jgi:ribosomal protein S18 acetylase RimI-like enzyme